MIRCRDVLFPWGFRVATRMPVLRYHAIIRLLFYPRALPPPTSGPVVYFADLSIDIRDFQFSNGVIGKVVTYDITERD
jgi:hypothetical protein